jgi:hypothetical protein
MSRLKILFWQRFRMKIVRQPTNSQVLDPVMIFALETFADESDIFGAGNAVDFSVSLLFCQSHLWCFGEKCDLQKASLPFSEMS